MERATLPWFDQPWILPSNESTRPYDEEDFLQPISRVRRVWHDLYTCRVEVWLDVGLEFATIWFFRCFDYCAGFKSNMETQQ